MLEVAELGCERNLRMLFSGLAFELSAGELLHVTGANGSGKTSLLRILCGLLEPACGEVRWQGTAIGALAEDYRRRLLYIGHASGLKDDLTPAENLRIAAAVGGVAVTQSALDAALQAFGLENFVRAPVKTLSQGQRRRAALARLAIARDQPLWLLDEPFSGLDQTAVAHVARLVEAHLTGGGLAVITAHEALPAGARPSRAIELGGPAS